MNVRVEMESCNLGNIFSVIRLTTDILPVLFHEICDIDEDVNLRFEIACIPCNCMIAGAEHREEYYIRMAWCE